ncbi:hypothetical protein PTTG_28670 [Puccinia triticina 1-1 BBBD Race 1]|uniref:hAT-like transposase RNase-H fold domain-containing protein n=1 Tax=Puccinia triticina (isolate 1-1 / race 1 (BBBD)) TaxID=630390 RepID=A0A180GA43_PUCT1|nr:hypothetical protein PTTG_28670 [Puccinia triticina 1-1 BBBD Race 1]
MHCDSSNQAGRNAKGCPKNNEAKASGMKLQPLIDKKRLIDGKQTPMSTFLQTKPVFVNCVLNQIIMIWQVRQTIAWAQIEDSILCAAFLYANPNSLVNNGRQKNLRGFIKLDTKFTLIHDVWMTKGNRSAFIGAAVAYVDSNWDYVFHHIPLKMIPWKHHGNLLAHPIAALLKKHDLYKKMLAQTTDSGSNNNIMASAMYLLLNNNNPSKESDDSWDPASMHIKCFCHKLALIVNAGLYLLLLKALPPGKAKESVLGFFPVFRKVLEEDETELANGAPEVKLAPGPKTNPAELEENDEEKWQSNYGNANNISNNDSASSVNKNKGVTTGTTNIVKTAIQGEHSKTTKLQERISKLDVVIKQITQSAARRANFERVAEEMNVKVSPLIAGYGIRWNIKYQSHRKFIEAPEVIDCLLKEDQGCQP